MNRARGRILASLASWMCAVAAIGQNLLRNPGFEDDDGYGSAQDWWFYGSAGRAVWAARQGLAGYSFYPAGSPYGGFGQDCTLDADGGRYLVFTIHARAEPGYVNANTTVAIELWHDGAKAAAAVTNVSEQLARDRGTWSPVRLTCGPVPPGISQAKVHCAFSDSTIAEGAASATCQWDDGVLVQVASVEPEETPIPPEQPRPASGEAGEPPSGPDAAAPAAAGNLAPAAGFEAEGDAVTGAPKGWTPFGSHGQSLSVTGVAARTGSHSVLMRAIGRANAFQGIYCTREVEPGETYQFEAYVRNHRDERLGGTGQGFLVIEWYGAAEAEIGRCASEAWDGNLSRLRWERREILKARVPQGATRARFVILLSDGKKGAEGSFLVDDVLIRRL